MIKTPKLVLFNDLNLKNIIKEAVKIIKKEGVIICPTDTVYGLIGDATNKNAVKKIFKIKKRNINKPLPIFVKDIRMAKRIVQITKKEEDFLKKVWPGKVTVILKKKIKGLKIYGTDKRTIGLRIPNYKLVTEIIRTLNKPLTATSANISGKSSSTKIKEVLKQFKKEKLQPDLIIDANNLPESKPSKIVDLTFDPPKILRD